MPDPTEFPAQDRSSGAGLPLLGALALCGALFSVAFAGVAALEQDWTTDEHIHLDWSGRFWNSGELERDSMGRYASTTPISVPNAALRQLIEARGVEEERVTRFAARAPQLVWLLLTFVGVFVLGQELGGPLTARVAVLLASLDPNLIANATVVTTDLPLAASTALTLAAAVAHRRQPSPGRAAALGAFVGLALTAKFSAILLVPLAVGAAFVRIGLEVRRLAWHAAAGVFTAWLVLVLAYGSRQVFEPIGSSAWQSTLFQDTSALAPKLPVPLPMSFLEGVDRSRARDAVADPIVAILGRVQRGPFWYYFPAAWSLKTPIALMLLSLAFAPWLLRTAARRPDVAWLLAHQGVTLLFFSLAFRTQLGYRYTLMLVPITYSLVAVAATSSLGRRTLTAAMVAITGLCLVETGRFWGDPLAFSNALVQPKTKAYLYLSNADIDWNQNQFRWTESRRAAGLPDNGALNPVDLMWGLNVVSTSRLAGVFPGDRFKWARENLEPSAMAGWTHHYFDVTESQYEQFLAEARRVPPASDAPQLCGLSASGAMDAPGIETTYETDRAPAGTRISILCVATRRGTDLSARVVGGGRFDLIPPARLDLRTYLGPGQSVQFRLDPGVHVFAIVETPYRRDSLPYHLQVVFASTRHGALLRVVEMAREDLPPSLSGLSGTN